MLKKFFTYILNLFLHIYDKQDRDLSDSNWYNGEEEDYTEKETLPLDLHPPSPDRKLKKADHALIKFHSPVEDDQPYVTSPYGFRIIFGKRRFHSGTDFRARHGSPAYAVEDSVVVEIVKMDPKFPNRFKYINGKAVDSYPKSKTPRIVYKGLHTGNLYFHKHCQRDSHISVGAKIEWGTKIGHYGDYGYSKGSHNHQEVHIWTGKKHKRVNSRVWLKKRAGIVSVGRTRSITVEAFEAFDVGK